MHSDPNFSLPKRRGSHRPARLVVAVLVAFASIITAQAAAGSDSDWRALPLVTAGKVDTNWVFLGWGKFVVDDRMLRTDPDPKGLGLLVYKKEKLV